MQSASALNNAPSDIGSEVAFAGRSNAGKSSALNALTENHKLARTSKTPGRTQLINFFEVEENVRLVDLPGYGFAKVPLSVKHEWNKQLERYLQYRRSLKGLVLLMDIRHPLKDFDQQMIEWAVTSEMPVHIPMSKTRIERRREGRVTQSARSWLSERLRMPRVRVGDGTLLLAALETMWVPYWPDTKKSVVPGSTKSRLCC